MLKNPQIQIVLLLMYTVIFDVRVGHSAAVDDNNNDNSNNNRNIQVY